MKTAKLSSKNRTQAVKIRQPPRSAGQKVYIRQVEQEVVVFPSDNPWQPLFDALGQFSPDFMADGRCQPPLDKWDIL
jgi:virulence-associated protein VagC